MNCKTIALAAILAMAGTGQGAAKTYHAPAFFGLNGPVKEVVKTNGGTDAESFEAVELSFTPEGKLIEEEDGEKGYKYDEAGYITECRLANDMGIESVIHAVYDSNGVLTAQVVDMTEPFEGQLTITNEFDADGHVVAQKNTSELKDKKLAAMIPPGAMPEIYTVFSYIDYDSHGNWTKRTVTVNMTNVDSEYIDVKPIVSTETRTITYYTE